MEVYLEQQPIVVHLHVQLEVQVEVVVHLQVQDLNQEVQVIVLLQILLKVVMVVILIQELAVEVVEQPLLVVMQFNVEMQEMEVLEHRTIFQDHQQIMQVVVEVQLHLTDQVLVQVQVGELPPLLP